MGLWQSLFDEGARRGILRRLEALRPDAPPRWGTMTAPRMVCHLTDQMRHALGLVAAEARRGPLRLPGVRWLSIYLLPWPRGRIQGPPEAFVTKPATWEADLGELRALVERFAARGPAGSWPDHILFGPMSGADWGVFAHKHFDHHLRQFGV